MPSPLLPLSSLPFLLIAEDNTCLHEFGFTSFGSLTTRFRTHTQHLTELAEQPYRATRRFKVDFSHKTASLTSI
jgi:hypothetical protein